MGETVYVGNAGVDGATNAGWLLGHFAPPGEIRHSTDVEVKWGVHPPGEARSRWATGERRTTLLVLVQSVALCWRRRSVWPHGRGETRPNSKHGLPRRLGGRAGHQDRRPAAVRGVRVSPAGRSPGS